MINYIPNFSMRRPAAKVVFAALIAFSLLSNLLADDREQVASPISPADSLKYIHVRPGFKVELVAAEPLIEDPVAFDWGPDGKLWVVEMHDYPLGLDGKGKPGGRVRYLEDTDGDGKYDKSTLIADDLPYANGVMAWGKGALVTSAPRILYLEDADGDGKAEIRTPLYEGFTEGNPQLRVNGLRWGLDNWVYCANGFSSVGHIKSIKSGETFDIGGRDLRIRPDEGLLDPQMGRSQFGRNRDAFGNWFGVHNANPLFHYVLDDRYVRRNPHYAPPDSRIDVSIDPKQSVIYPRSRPGKFFHESQAGRFTSANSAMIFGDDLWGPEFAGNSFVSEPVHNLVHREIVSPKGVTFTSRRADDEKESEFLASSDTWFRPATLRTGPDGALWIADMYRETVEHPQWIPPDTIGKLDLRAGSDRGRIYRVYPDSVGNALRGVPKLDRLSVKELVALFESPNSTQRDMAHQYIVNRKLVSAAEPLTKLAVSGKLPVTRLQALCALDGLGKLDLATLKTALKDQHGGVRRQAVRLCEGRFDAYPELATLLLNMNDDNDATVQLQLACTLGESLKELVGFGLGMIAVNNREEPLILAAVFSSVSVKNVEHFISPLLDSEMVEAEDAQHILAPAATIAAGYGRQDLAGKAMVSVVAYSEDAKAVNRFASMADMLDSLERSKLSLPKILKSFQDEGRGTAKKLNAIFTAARASADDLRAKDELRIGAVRLLGRAPDGRSDDVVRLGKLLVPQTPGSVQSAAVDALARLGEAGTPTMLLAGWKSHAPALRAQILDVLLGREAWTKELVAALEAGKLAPSDIDAARRQRLISSKNLEIKSASERLLAATVDADRKKVLADYQPALALAGDFPRGAALFGKKCAACHELGKQGKPVGPNLAGLSDKSPKALLTAILDPNQAVEPKFISYTAITTEGRIFVGILAEETGSGITLIDQSGNRHSLLRSELDDLQSSGKSLMPDGVEKELSPQDVADIMAYVASGGKSR